MKIEHLRSALRALPGLDSRWNTEEARSALSALDVLLAGSDNDTISDFCSRVKVSKPKRKAALSTSAALNAEAISRSIGELRASSADLETFNNVVKRLEKDKSVRLAEARAIASEFAGGGAFKTKRDAFKAIQQRRAADARSDNRRAHISDIF